MYVLSLCGVDLSIKKGIQIYFFLGYPLLSDNQLFQSICLSPTWPSISNDPLVMYQVSI